MFKSFKHPRQIEKFERHTVTFIIFGWLEEEEVFEEVFLHSEIKCPQ